MDIDRPRVLFHTYSRRGLGHLMRGLNIARELRQFLPAADILFYTRGEPPSGFVDVNIRFCCQPDVQGPDRWPNVVRSFAPHVVVFDTMIPKQCDSPCTANARTVFIMRKCRADRHREIVASSFLKSVDAIVVPHWPQEFEMDLPRSIRSKATFVGAIVRKPCEAARAELRQKYGLFEGAFLLVSTPGGGGFQQEADALFDVARGVHERLAKSLREFRHIVVQGPRYAGAVKSLADMTVVESEPALVSLMDLSDLVISAGGYNSVNEIRASKTPAVFLPSPRTHDDQATRVQRLVEAGLALSYPHLGRRKLIQKIASVCLTPSTRQSILDRYATDTMKTGNVAAARRIMDVMNP